MFKHCLQQALRLTFSLCSINTSVFFIVPFCSVNMWRYYRDCCGNRCHHICFRIQIAYTALFLFVAGTDGFLIHLACHQHTWQDQNDIPRLGRMRRHGRWNLLWLPQLVLGVPSWSPNYAQWQQKLLFNPVVTSDYITSQPRLVYNRNIKV